MGDTKRHIPSRDLGFMVIVVVVHDDPLELLVREGLTPQRLGSAL